MSENVLPFPAWRRDVLARMPKPRERLDEDTKLKLQAVSVASASEKTVDLHRYARQDRWRRRLDGLLLLAAYTASALLMGLLIAWAISTMLVRL